MLNRVKWVDTIKLFKKNNVNQILEIGPNKILNGLNKRIDSDFKFINLTNCEELENLKNEL